jgi:hypothetical protein
MRLTPNPRIAACLGVLFALSAPLAARPHSTGGVTILSGEDSVDVAVNLKPLEPLSPAMRAILAFYAMRGNGGCPPGTWSDDGKTYDMRCPLTTALGLGRQCSEEQIALVKAWFKDGVPRLTRSRADAASIDQATCQNTPYTATHQVIWQSLRVRMGKKGLVTVTAKGSWLGGESGGDFGYVTTYRVLQDRVQIVREREWHRRDA